MKKMDLQSGEKKPAEITNLWDWIRYNPNIIHDPGINWGTVYFLTDEQKDRFIALYLKSANAPRYDINKHVGFLNKDLSQLVKLRDWFNNEANVPGVKEKEYAIRLLREAMETNKFTGIHKDAYPQLIARLEAMPDMPDFEGWSIHFHY